MRDFVALHSWGVSCSLDAWCERMDALAGSVELGLVSAERDGAERKYARAGVSSIAFHLDQRQADLQAWAMVPAEAFIGLGQDTVARVFLGLINTFPPILARSFNELGHGVIKPLEVDGPLEFTDWFQYFSPRLVGRIGSEALSRVSQARVEFVPSGGCVLWLPGSPLDTISARSAVAEGLGITLRPLIAKNPKTGDPLTIPWT